jgi:hypothetical protein
MYVCVSGLSLDCVVGHLRPSHVFSSIHEVDLLAIDLHSSSSFPSFSYSGCHGYHLFVALQSDKDNLLEKGRHIKMSSWKYSCAPDSTREKEKTGHEIIAQALRRYTYTDNNNKFPRYNPAGMGMDNVQHVSAAY